MAFMELVILFSLIAILIGGMGIFAFAIFMVESKTREIALRKSKWGIGATNHVTV